MLPPPPPLPEPALGVVRPVAAELASAAADALVRALDRPTAGAPEPGSAACSRPADVCTTAGCRLVSRAAPASAPGPASTAAAALWPSAVAARPRCPSGSAGLDSSGGGGGSDSSPSPAARPRPMPSSGPRSLSDTSALYTSPSLIQGWLRCRCPYSTCTVSPSPLLDSRCSCRSHWLSCSSCSRPPPPLAPACGRAGREQP
jgi:hypothetical protein